MTFSLDVLKIDAAAESDRLAAFVAKETKEVYRRRGVVVGLSGGIDSAVMAALAVKAVDKDHVVGLILPERESNPLSSRYARAHAEALGIEHRVIDITATVDSVAPYAWRDAYLQGLVPDYTPECKYHISLPTDLLERDTFSFYVLRVQRQDGTMSTKRLSIAEFRTLTAFASIKVRSRMIQLYWEAERRGLVVAGTTNRTELILGDFCKYGDGGTDIEPLAHHYKDQIYQMAAHLDVTAEIRERVPSPDTFSLPVSDQEFFFRIPFDKLDLLLYAWEHAVEPGEAARVIGLDVKAVERAFKDFASKFRATAHLRELGHAPPKA